MPNYYVTVNSTLYFADTYSCGSYGASVYGDNTCTSETGGNAGGSLVDTGIGVVTIATLACIILLLAIVVRVWHRSRKNAIKRVAPIDNAAKFVPEAPAQVQPTKIADIQPTAQVLESPSVSVQQPTPEVEKPKEV